MTAAQQTRKDVLIADGTDFYRRMLSELLGGHGYRVIEADGVDSALAALEAERPDLVFLDLELPQGGGRAFLSQARERGWQALKVVAVDQAFHDEVELNRLRGEGVAAFVSRSAPIDDVLVAARSVAFPDEKNLRRSPRAQVHLPVSFRAEDARGESLPAVATHTFNLSADGMFLTATTVAPPPPGTRLELRFWLPRANEIIQTEGIVIWCNQAGGRVNELYPPGMGVMFLGLKRDHAALISDYVRERVQNVFH